MGCSVDLRIVYGVKIELSDAPWNQNEDDGDHGDWWREINGFKPTFYPYDSEGNYVDGVVDGDPRVTAYYEERKAWDEANPIPFDYEYDGDYGSEEIFVCANIDRKFYDSVELSKVVEEAKIDPQTEKAFRDFLKQHIGDVEPTWWLVPFYG